ncbi:MAG: HD domain-containing protein [Desulfobacterales bacterium]|nr:HD domain-containing protein [Desulfobacterales bacterium]
MKKKYINELVLSETVDDVFLLKEKTLVRKKDGEYFLSMVLVDKTGIINAVAWDHVERLKSEIAAGGFVRVKGSVGEYKASRQISVRDMEPVSSEEICCEDFMPATRRNVQQMLERLKKISETIETVHYRKLMTLFWQDDGFVDRFKLAPAAKKMHHAYLGGLLEHTLSLALLAERVVDHYGGIDRDLLLTGVMLHDIGKVKEFEYERSIEYSDEGRLISHIVIGIDMIEKKINQIEAFPEKASILLKHLIVSHHGSRELGSPQPPMTLEAVMLHYLDEIDSKVNGIREFMESNGTDGDWTPYHKLLERYFYKGK